MPDDPTEASARVGRVLNDKWTLERLIGLGGMAAVYAGRHRNGARAAVKILDPHLAQDPRIRERFLREGYAANRVDHPGAVKVLDDDFVQSGPDAGTAYIVMELLEGQSLEERLERPPPVSEIEFLSLAATILDVLDAAHRHDVIHRDLKPDNIFLVKDAEDTRRVKLLDFGIARLGEGGTNTQTGIVIGTPSYMSPEQAAGRSDEIDGRTDLFSLGATGYRLLAGRRIHEAEDMPLLIAMANEPAAPLRSVAPHVSERVAAIIDRAVAFRREDRYPTAAAMRADVHAALEAAGVVPSERGSVREIPIPIPRASAREPPPTDEEPDDRSLERRAGLPRTRSWGVPLLLAALVGGGGFYAWRVGYIDELRSRGAEPPPEPVVDGGSLAVDAGAGADAASGAASATKKPAHPPKKPVPVRPPSTRR